LDTAKPEEAILNWVDQSCHSGLRATYAKLRAGSLIQINAPSCTFDELGAKMKCDRCGKRPERYYPARQSDAPGFAKGY